LLPSHARLYNKLVNEMLESLTIQELAIAQGVGKGWSNALIAKDLGLAEQTVKNELGRIYDKLGLRHRVDLAVWWGKENHQQEKGKSA